MGRQSGRSAAHRPIGGGRPSIAAVRLRTVGVDEEAPGGAGDGGRRGGRMVRGAGQGAEAEAELQVALKGVGREQRLVGNKPGRNDGERWASKQPSAAQAKKIFKAAK